MATSGDVAGSNRPLCHHRRGLHVCPRSHRRSEAPGGGPVV